VFKESVAFMSVWLFICWFVYLLVCLSVGLYSLYDLYEIFITMIILDYVYLLVCLSVGLFIC
jgi:hypothetical protein